MEKEDGGLKAEMVQRFLEQVITEKEQYGKSGYGLESRCSFWIRRGKNPDFDEKSGNTELLRIEDEKENSGIENGSMADSELIRALMEIFARHSLYAYEREISQGFLTIRGGHRIGITGKAVVESGHVKTVRDISSLNIRIAHEIKGCAKSVLPHLLSGEEFLDTLVISPPGAGKTTLLRDLIRELSSGGSWGSGKNVSVVDERSEIAACFGGVPQCDLGPRTDVMDGCPKGRGHAHDAALHGTAGTGGRRSGRGGGDPGDEIRDEMRVPDPCHGPWSGHGGHHETSGVERHRGERRYFPDMWSSLGYRHLELWRRSMMNLYVNAERKAPVKTGMQRQHQLPISAEDDRKMENEKI